MGQFMFVIRGSFQYQLTTLYADALPYLMSRNDSVDTIMQLI